MNALDLIIIMTVKSSISISQVVVCSFANIYRLLELTPRRVCVPD